MGSEWDHRWSALIHHVCQMDKSAVDSTASGQPPQLKSAAINVTNQRKGQWSVQLVRMSGRLKCVSNSDNFFYPKSLIVNNRFEWFDDIVYCHVLPREEELKKWEESFLNEKQIGVWNGVLF